MQTTMLARLACVILLSATVAACATPYTVPSASVTTLDPAGSRYLTLDWSAAPAGADKQHVDGYIANSYGRSAQVLLLAQGLDASGQVVDQKIDYGLAPVPGLGRAYFHIGPLAAADHYRVTVWSAYFFEGRNIR